MTPPSWFTTPVTHATPAKIQAFPEKIGGYLSFLVLLSMLSLGGLLISCVTRPPTGVFELVQRSASGLPVLPFLVCEAIFRAKWARLWFVNGELRFQRYFWVRAIRLDPVRARLQVDGAGFIIDTPENFFAVRPIEAAKFEEWFTRWQAGTRN